MKKRSSRRKARSHRTVVFLLVLILLGGLLYGYNAKTEKSGFQPITLLSKITEKDLMPENRPHTADGERKSVDWNLILVNPWNLIPDDYEFDLIQLSNGESVDKRIYPDLQKMFDAARSEGVYPVVRSGYRTAEKQQELLDDKIRVYQNQGYSFSEAEKLAQSWVAVPGTSEHQLGLAVDINADEERSSDEEVYDWLYYNSYQYGFILRYPADKTGVTGTSYEPWHYRYVGAETAKAIREQGICLEEYLKKNNDGMSVGGRDKS